MHAAPSITNELHKLKSLRTALDGQDAILREAIEGNPNYEVSIAQWSAIRGTFDDLRADFPSLAIESTFNGHPSAIRAQISAARARIETTIGTMEYSSPEERNKNELRPAKESVSTGIQIRRLREECRWTVETLASKIDRHPTTVSRNESDTLTPQATTLAAYERVFSKRLGRKIVIDKTLLKR